MSSKVENPSGRFLTNRVTTTQTRKQFTNRLSEYCHPFIILNRSPLTNRCTTSELFALPTNQTIDSTPSTDHHSLPSFVAFLLIASTKDDLRFLITNNFFHRKAPLPNDYSITEICCYCPAWRKVGNRSALWWRATSRGAQDDVSTNGIQDHGQRDTGLDPESGGRPPSRARTPATLDPPLHSANSCTIIATWTIATQQDRPDPAS